MKKEEEKKRIYETTRERIIALSRIIYYAKSLWSRDILNISPNDTSKIRLELEIRGKIIFPLVTRFEEEKLSRVSCIQNESTIISVFQNISVGKEERKPSCRKG